MEKDATTLCPKQTSHFVISMPSPITDRLAKFFHWHILLTLCNKVIIKYLISKNYLAKQFSCLN